MNKRLAQLWKSFRGIPLWVQIWLIILTATNMASFWFLDSTIGYWTAIAFAIVGGINMPAMIIQAGLTRFLSLIHMVWVPLLVFLYPLLFGQNAVELDGSVYFLGVMVFVINGTSLLFDFYESFRWLRGDREVLGLET